MKLLTRTAFKNAVFKRDGYTCIFCNNIAEDAHHILDRKLFKDGGYYLNNGASVCSAHHKSCEYTLIQPLEIYYKLGIDDIILPEHFDTNVSYDKWGNIILSDFTRAKGELYYHENVQIALKRGDALKLFSPYVKYPRTYHLHWSEGVQSDDIKLVDGSIFEDQYVVVTEKMDGENTTLYNDHIHARSLDSRNHFSRNWVKGWWSKFKFDIPQNMRICGENLYAQHSIKYENLKSYFYGFSIWENDVCLSWSDTLDYFELLDITSPKVLYSGIYDENIIKQLSYENSEGYVVRVQDSFKYINFKNSVAKVVRANHVQTDSHWIHSEIKPNQLAK